MTIEKDKEDQRKFYASYPNPHVLDMKWKNSKFTLFACSLKSSINKTHIYIYNIYIYICRSIHRHVFCPSQGSSVWLWLMSTEQLMYQSAQSTRCWAFPKCLWWTNRKYSVLISALESAQWINSERIYSQTCVSSFPGLISVAGVHD